MAYPVRPVLALPTCCPPYLWLAPVAATCGCPCREWLEKRQCTPQLSSALGSTGSLTSPVVPSALALLGLPCSLHAFVVPACHGSMAPSSPHALRTCLCAACGLGLTPFCPIPCLRCKHPEPGTRNPSGVVVIMSINDQRCATKPRQSCCCGPGGHHVLGPCLAPCTWPGKHGSSFPGVHLCPCSVTVHQAAGHPYKAHPSAGLNIAVDPSRASKVPALPVTEISPRTCSGSRTCSLCSVRLARGFAVPRAAPCMHPHCKTQHLGLGWAGYPWPVPAQVAQVMSPFLKASRPKRGDHISI